MNKKLIDFDTVEVSDNLTDFSKRIRWLKGKKVVLEKQIRFSASKYPLCLFCLRYYGEEIEMTDKVTRRFEGEDFTHMECPERNNHCTCGQIRHRVFCPLGFNNYFTL